MRISDWSSDVCSSDLDAGYQALEQAAGQLIGQAHQQRELANVFTLYNTATPRVYADIDRAKSDMLGVPPSRVFEALQVYLGSAYVNDFNLLGRTFRVTAQAAAAAREKRQGAVSGKGV